MIVDGDTSYGNALNTIRTIQALGRTPAPRAPSSRTSIFVEAPESVEELQGISAATPGCVRVANMIEGGRTPLRSPEELHELGFDLIVSPLTGILATHRAMTEAVRRVAERGVARGLGRAIARICAIALEVDEVDFQELFLRAPAARSTAASKG